MPSKNQKQKNRRDPASSGKKLGQLTPRRKLFIELVPVYMNYSRAAREAGYSKKASATEGARLMAVPEIRAAVEQRISERAAAMKLTAENVIFKLEHNYYGAVEDRDWNAANAAAKDQGKHLGMFKEKVQIDFTTSYAALVIGSMGVEPAPTSPDTDPVEPPTPEEEADAVNEVSEVRQESEQVDGDTAGPESPGKAI